VSAPRSTIVVVDDADDVRRLLEETLGESHLVKTAPGGEAALALAREAPPPDLILIDTKLAGASGYELCKALRALPGLAEVPVIFLAERRYPHRVGQTYRLKYNPGHRWFYFPEMRRDEALVFKVYDSETDGRARFTPHTSFVDPATPPGSSPRQSIEARAMAFF